MGYHDTKNRETNLLYSRCDSIFSIHAFNVQTEGLGGTLVTVNKLARIDGCARVDSLSNLVGVSLLYLLYHIIV